MRRRLFSLDFLRSSAEGSFGLRSYSGKKVSKPSIEVGKDGQIFFKSKGAENWSQNLAKTKASDPKTTPWYKTPWALGAGFAVLGFGSATYILWDTMREYDKAKEDGVLSVLPVEGVISNWSGTHETSTLLFQPASEDELEDLVAEAHQGGRPIRAVGSALSPNGLSFERKGMLSMALLDKIVKVDVEAREVTVQAGARVQSVVEALLPHGLTLENFASVREQQIGGYTQVSAHGTGATIGPVDTQIVRLRLVTPAGGVLDLSEEDGQLFHMAKVGLGALGIVSEVTLRCVPVAAHVEVTRVMTRAAVKEGHVARLRENRHVKYLWIPYTDSVVVVTVNPLKEGEAPPRPTPVKEWDRGRALRDLYLKERPGDKKKVQSDSGPALRDRLLGLRPTDPEWIKKVNAAESQYWRRSEGLRVGRADELLGFDCGGQQWVVEVAFETGTLAAPSGADMRFMDELLSKIESRNIAAQSPIEQRWTAASPSPMSPAHGGEGKEGEDKVFSWVGVIMYLPAEADAAQREEIRKSFESYSRLVQSELGPSYAAATHWAKLEIPEDYGEKLQLRDRLKSRFPVEAFNRLRKQYDPKGVLANDWIVGAFGHAK